MKTITLEWLRKQGACSDGLKWFKNIAETDTAKLYELVMTSDDNDVLEYANWGIVRLFTHEQAVQYAVYAAELALNYYDEDGESKAAIAAAKAWLANPCEATRDTAYDAATRAAAAAAACAAPARAAACAAYSAPRADAAYAAAACAARFAADAAYAAFAADSVAYSVYIGILKQCIEYGYTLLEKCGGE